MDKELERFLKEHIYISDYGNRDLTHFHLDVAINNNDELTKKLIDFLNN